MSYSQFLYANWLVGKECNILSKFWVKEKIDVFSVKIGSEYSFSSTHLYRIQINRSLQVIFSHFDSEIYYIVMTYRSF